MARSKRTSQQPDEEMASDVAELAASQDLTNAPSSSDIVHVSDEVLQQTQAAYRQDMACDIFRALVHGLRIQVKDGESPGTVAQRLMDIHAKLMIRATEAGIIPEDQQ